MKALQTLFLAWIQARAFHAAYARLERLSLSERQALADHGGLVRVALEQAERQTAPLEAAWEACRERAPVVLPPAAAR